MDTEYRTPEDLKAVLRTTYWVEDEITLDKVLHDLTIYAPHFFFRGLRRSSYKLFNTWQRHQQMHPDVLNGFRDFDHYWGQRLYNQQMEADDSYNRQLAEVGIEPSDDLARLSFMQHHGEHTPFLDFTEDPFVAMRFAVQEPNAKSEPPVPLDSWFCIHGIPRALVELFNQRYAEAIDRNRQRPDLVVGRTYSKYMFFSEGPFLFMYRPWLIKHLGEPYGQIMNNVFIFRQRGLFLFQRNQQLPFTEALLEYQYANGLDGTRGELPSNHLFCINIRRELTDIVQQRLDTLGPSHGYSYILPKVGVSPP